jgi:uncharacterized protein YjbI with pentapeptide repeats
VSVLFGVTLWNVLKIFAVPITVGAAVPWLNWLQKTRELKVESQRAQDEALEAYLDQMSKLLLDKERPLRQSAEADKAEEDANGRTVARARTLTVLSRFDGHRKGRVVQFLYEAGLVMNERSIVDLYQSDLREARLNGASLRGADLYGVDLREADLSWANLIDAWLVEADLRGANLRADLRSADLRSADLRNADLYGTWVQGANLGGADLRGAYLSEADLSSVDLHGAHLGEADLRGTILRETNLYGANLSGADLTGASVTPEQLERVDSLAGATMPNGQKYEEWLNSRGEGDSGS